jgi:HAD superfamily hydrolase (TIGR01457 family)
VNRTLSDLRSVRGVLFDMDGVIYVGETPLAGVQDALDYLTKTGRKWLLVTNNASRTPEQFVEKLTKMNMRVRPEQVLGSAEATACWLAEQVQHHGWPGGPVIVMGQTGLKTALTNSGFELTSDPDQAVYAVAGINFELTYEDLANVSLAIRRGARFIGTNGDVTYPSERGPLPGAGSILALLATASGKQPLVIGKPNAGMYEQAMARLGLAPAETLMVGDRYDTDISGAIALGLQTAGILTGISTRAEFEQVATPPTLIVEDLPNLIDAFRQADASAS